MHIVNIKKAIVQMAHASRSSHVGSCLSLVEILYVLYFSVLNVDPKDPGKADRDKLILSKGHASAALYATLAAKGFFAPELLARCCVDNGVLAGHPDRNAVPGIEVSTGSLGHGLSIGLGMALANQQADNPGRVFVILGDGECNEGSVWEAAMLAPCLKLANLTAIIDYNKLQAFGRTNDVVDQTNMAERWRSFGWEVSEVDGHNINQLENTLQLKQTGPKTIIAHTVKGKGVSFMENKLEWHYRSPDDKELAQAMRELDAQP